MTVGKSFCWLAVHSVMIREHKPTTEPVEWERIRRRHEEAAPPALREVDRLLLSLRDDQSLSWKDITEKFNTETGQDYKIPALQMRYKRLKEKLQTWTEKDIKALKQAYSTGKRDHLILSAQR